MSSDAGTTEFQNEGETLTERTGEFGDEITSVISVLPYSAAGIAERIHYESRSFSHWSIHWYIAAEGLAGVSHRYCWAPTESIKAC